MPRNINYIFILVCGTLAVPASAADVQLSVEPVRVEFVESEFVGDPERRGFEVSGTWELSNTLDIRVGWSDAHTQPRSVVSSPFWSDYSARGYSLAFSQQAFGPFELYGRVEVMDVDVSTSGNLKLSLAESPRRITIAGASARWRPTSDKWGFEAGANRATGRPTFVGIGVFISF